MQRCTIGLLVTLALVILAAPLAVAAQQAEKVWRLGFISVTPMQIDDIFFRHYRV